MFGWISYVAKWVDVVFWDMTESDCLLSPCSSLWFFLITLCSCFNFIRSLYTCLGVKGIRVMILPSFKIVYLFWTPSCIAFLSYCHGLPNKIWLVCIGTTSHRTSLTSFSIENGTKICLVTFNSSLSFNYCNLYGWGCLTVHKFILLTMVVLAVLVQHPLLII